MTKINSTGSHNISWSKKSYLRIFPIEVIHRANIIQTSAPHHHPIILEECWLPLLLLVRLPRRLPAAWSYHQQLGDDPTVIGTTCLLDLAGSLKLHTKKLLFACDWHWLCGSTHVHPRSSHEGLAVPMIYLFPVHTWLTSCSNPKTRSCQRKGPKLGHRIHSAESLQPLSYWCLAGNEGIIHNH